MSDAARARKRLPRRRSRRFAFLAAALVIAVLPLLLTGNYWQTNLTCAPSTCCSRSALDFILGYAGQLNLGQSAFYGHRRLRLDLAHHQARHAVLGRVCGGVVFAGARRHAPRAVRRAAARTLSRHRVARLRGDHRTRSCSTGSASPQGPLGIYAHPAAARDRDPGPADDRLPQPGGAVLPGRRIRAARPTSSSISWCARRSARR